jgi:hypothetical protein
VDNIKINLGEMMWIELFWHRIEQMESSCEFGDDPLVPIKCWEHIEWPNIWRPLEYCSAP